MAIGRVPGATGIQPSIVDAKGDLIAATAADSVSRLAVGANGTVLTADSAEATGLKWAAAGKVLQVIYASTSTDTTIASTTYADTTLSATITPSATSSKILVLVSQVASITRATTAAGGAIKLVRGATDILVPSPNRYQQAYIQVTASTTQQDSTIKLLYLDSPNTTSATTYKTQGAAESALNSGAIRLQVQSGISTMVLMEIGA